MTETQTINEEFTNHLTEVTLVVVGGPLSGLSVQLTNEKERYVGGRGNDSDITLRHSTVSRRHFELRFDDDAGLLRLRALDSTNGTFIGNSRDALLPPGQECSLFEGSTFAAGDIYLRVNGHRVKQVVAMKGSFGGFICESRPMRKLLAKLHYVMQARCDLLVYGEVGVGKSELINAMARETGLSLRTIDCRRVQNREIDFEAIEEQIVYFDAIDELPKHVQSQVAHELERDGRKTMFVFSCISLESLQESIARGRFLDELFLRIVSTNLMISPLRHRLDDIIPLAEHFAAKIGKSANRQYSFEETGLAFLRSQPWPGNLIELKSLISQAIVFSKGRPIDDKLLRKCLVRNLESRFSAEPPIAEFLGRAKEYVYRCCSGHRPVFEGSKDVGRDFTLACTEMVMSRSEDIQEIAKALQCATRTARILRDDVKAKQSNND